MNQVILFNHFIYKPELILKIYLANVQCCAESLHCSLQLMRFAKSPHPYYDFCRVKTDVTSSKSIELKSRVLPEHNLGSNLCASSKNVNFCLFSVQNLEIGLCEIILPLLEKRWNPSGYININSMNKWTYKETLKCYCQLNKWYVD